VYFDTDGAAPRHPSTLAPTRAEMQPPAGAAL